MKYNFEYMLKNRLYGIIGVIPPRNWESSRISYLAILKVLLYFIPAYTKVLPTPLR